MYAWIVGLIARNWGGKIGLGLGVVVCVFGVVVLLVSGGDFADSIFGAFLWVVLCAIATPVLGIVGSIIGAIVKAIVGTNRNTGEASTSDKHKSFRLTHNRDNKKSTNQIAKVFERCNTLFDKGDFDKVIEEAANLISADPKLVDGYGWRGRAYFEKGDFSKAIADFTEVIRLDPNNAAAYFYRGNAYLNANSEMYDAGKAVNDYTMSIKFDPDRAEAYFQRGCAYFDNEEYDKVFVDLDEAIRREPSALIAYFMRAVYNAKLGNIQEAIIDCEKFLKLDSNSKDAEFIRNMLDGLKSGKPFEQE